MPHIFISYAKKDTRAFAEALLRELSVLPGITAWMDTSLAADSSWAAQIEDEIDRADYVIVLISPDVNRKESATQSRSFVLNEIDFAQQERKAILPVMVQRARIPLQLAGVQYIDLTATPSHTAPVIERVRQRFNIPAPPPPKPPASSGASAASPASIPTPAAPARRSNGRLIAGAALVLLILAAVVVIVLPSLNQTPESPGLDTVVETQAAARTATYLAGEWATVMAGTPFPTGVPTLDLRVGYAPVTRNADWTPVERDFDGVTMVMVPAGCFNMGSDPDARDWTNLEVPDGGLQCFDVPFWIDKYEVTNGQFAAFAGRAESMSHSMGEKQPRETISWTEAYAFCAVRGGRFPTEREWEYAARGPDNLLFPWGDTLPHDTVVPLDTSNGETWDVGVRPQGQSWVGAFDMSGNVSEWTSTQYSISDVTYANTPNIMAVSAYPYPYVIRDGREQAPESADDVRVIRGGAWHEETDRFRAASRGFERSAGTNSDVGFRCARSVTPPAPVLGG